MLDKYITTKFLILDEALDFANSLHPNRDVKKVEYNGEWYEVKYLEDNPLNRKKYNFDRPYR